MVKKEVLKFRKLTLLSNLGHNIKVEGSYFVHNPPPPSSSGENLFIYLFIFRERGREGRREGEKHQYVVASRMSLTGDLASNTGMCPD